MLALYAVTLLLRCNWDPGFGICFPVGEKSIVCRLDIFWVQLVLFIRMLEHRGPKQHTGNPLGQNTNGQGTESNSALCLNFLVRQFWGKLFSSGRTSQGPDLLSWDSESPAGMWAMGQELLSFLAMLQPAGRGAAEQMHQGKESSCSEHTCLTAELFLRPQWER